MKGVPGPSVKLALMFVDLSIFDQIGREWRLKGTVFSVAMLKNGIDG